MKFTFDRDAMIKVISVAQEVITNRSPISILSNILIIAENNKLTIKATDSTLNFTTYVPVDILEEGRTTIYCDKFLNILTSLPSGEIEYIQDDITATIKPISKKIKFQLKSQTSDKFPELGSSENVPFFELSAKDFKEMIKHTTFAVDKDIIFLSGVNFSKENDILTMIGTNGKRLSSVSKNALNVLDFQSAIVPVKILNCVLKHLSDEGNLNVSVIDKSIFIKFANFEFSSNLIDGQYPNCKRVIPQDLSSSFKVNKNDLEAALKRISIMADSKLFRIIFKISSGNLKLIAPENNNGVAEEEIPCRYDGQDITMGINFTYVMEPLKFIESEYVKFEFNTEENVDNELVITKAIILKAENECDYLHVIVPLK